MINLEHGQLLSLYRDSESLLKSSQTSFRKEFRQMSGTDGPRFVGLTSDNEVYEIVNAD